MRAFVVGLHHDLQPVEPFPSKEAGQRAHAVQAPLFRTWLGAKIVEVAATVLGEEASPGIATIAQEVARERRIRPIEIDMPYSERVRLGIPENYWPLYKARVIPSSRAWKYNRAREDFMVSRLMEETKDEDSVIVLVGRLHVCGLVARLSREGSTAIGYDLRKEPWYEEWHWE